MPAEKCLPVEEMTIARAVASSLILFTISGSSFQNARVMVLKRVGALQLNVRDFVLASRR